MRLIVLCLDLANRSANPTAQKAAAGYTGTVRPNKDKALSSMTTT